MLYDPIYSRATRRRAYFVDEDDTPQIYWQSLDTADNEEYDAPTDRQDTL